jgi:hypothetical protein
MLGGGDASVLGFVGGVVGTRRTKYTSPGTFSSARFLPCVMHDLRVYSREALHLMIQERRRDKRCTGELKCSRLLLLGV